MKHKTTEEFIAQAKKVHHDKYDYSLVDYKCYREKIKIICSMHGVFQQYPQNHLKGRICKKCSTNLSKKTIEKFTEQAKEIHDNKYDYSLVEYENGKTKIKIICPIHGIFQQSPKLHINRKDGCPKCSKNLKSTTEEFIKKSKEIHGDRYDYSLVEYTNNFKKIKIICKKHGIFEQQPNKHLSGQNCIFCSGLKRKTTEEFIEQAKKIHGDRYDYSLVEYKNTRTKIKIICPIHGIFYQEPMSHLTGHNCNFCKKIYFKEEQHLYIFKDVKYNIYKIGVSNDVNRRCRELNSKYYKLIKNIEIVKIFQNKGILENNIHNNFKSYNIYHPTKIKNERSDGRTEWFNFNVDDCIKYINFII